MQICQPMFGKRLQSVSSAPILSSSGAAVCGIHHRKMSARLLIGLLTQLSSIFVRERSARTSTTRTRYFGFHANRSSAHRTPVRTGFSNKAPLTLQECSECRFLPPQVLFQQLQEHVRSNFGISRKITVMREQLFARERLEYSPNQIRDLRCYVDTEPILEQSVSMNGQQHQRFADTGAERGGVFAHLAVDARHPPFVLREFKFGSDSDSTYSANSMKAVRWLAIIDGAMANARRSWKLPPWIRRHSRSDNRLLGAGP